MNCEIAFWSLLVGPMFFLNHLKLFMTESRAEGVSSDNFYLFTIKNDRAKSKKNARPTLSNSLSRLTSETVKIKRNFVQNLVIFIQNCLRVIQQFLTNLDFVCITKLDLWRRRSYCITYIIISFVLGRVRKQNYLFITAK